MNYLYFLKIKIKMRFKLLSLLLGLMLSYQSLLAYDFAEGNFGYTIIDIVERTCSVEIIDKEISGEINIPSSVLYNQKEFKVWSITDYGFSECKELNSIIIGNGIVNIGTGSFSGCLNLKTIILPQSILNIFDEAFTGCGIEKLQLPDDIPLLRANTFKDCLYLKEIEFPNNLNTIESNCFSGCPSLENFDWPVGCTEILSNTFNNCEIKKIVIPTTVNKLSSSAFLNCQINELIIEGDENSSVLDLIPDSGNYGNHSKINNIYILRELEENSGYVERFALKIDGDVNLYLGTNIGKSFSTYILNYASIDLLYFYDSIETIKIEGTTKWYPKTIYMGRNFTNVDLNGRINVLSSQLQSVTFSNMVTKLPTTFFKDCPIKNIELPNSLESIGFNTFYNSDITSIKIPDSVTEIAYDAFNGSKLTNIFIGDGVQTIHSNTFSGLNINILNLGSNIKNIEKDAFSNCELKYLLCKSKTPPSCNKESFTQDQYLNSLIVVPDESYDLYLNETPWNAFFNMNYGYPITNIKISPSFISLKEGTSTFLDIEYETEYSGGLPIIDNLISWNSSDKNIAGINSSGYLIANSVGDCTITATYNNNSKSLSSKCQVTVISNLDRYKFQELENGTAELIANNYEGFLSIPETTIINDKEMIVSSINENAFKGCKNLEGIFIPGSVEMLSNDIFNDCINLRFVSFNYSPNSIKLGSNTNLQVSNDIIPFPNPSNVDEKRTGFRNCYYDGLFYDLPIEELVINRNIELSLYYERKMSNKSGNYETVYNDIVYYPPFYGLKNLKSVEIGENVTSICQNTIDVVMNAVPTVMNYTNFGQCENIQTVISKNPIAPVGGGFSQSAYKNATLYLPNGGKTSYQSDEYWKNFVNIIEGNYIPVESIKIEQESVELPIEGTLQLKLIVNPENATYSSISWTSSNEKIVTVSETGVLTGIVEGTAIVTATIGDIQTTCEVSVYNPIVEAESIILNIDESQLYINDTLQLEATVLPENTTDKTVTWQSSNIYVATVNESGLITAISEGNATITATNGNISVTCQITVLTPIIDAEQIILNIESAEINIGESVQLEATVLPEDTADKSLSWYSSDSNIARVSEDGLVAAVSAGIAIISVSCGEVSAECTITVLEDAGIESLLANPDTKVSIFSTDGILIKKGCKVEDLKTLNKGIYIIVSGKEHYKISI